MARKKKVRESKSPMIKNTEEMNKILPDKVHEPGDAACFIIDGMNIAYSSYYTHSRLKHGNFKTGIMFGIINTIKSILVRHHPTKVVVVWDGMRDKRRIEKWGNYKGHRGNKYDTKEGKSFLKQVERTKKLLYRLGVPQAHNPDVEGDDMIYLVTKSLKSIYPIIIYSGDKDFNQLITKDIRVLHPISKYSNTWWTFPVDHGVKITQYVDYLCLVGDKSDDIPGYHGIGPVRAKSFLKQHGSIKAYLNNKKAEFAGMNDKDKLKKIWLRNRFLIDLKRFNEKFHTSKSIKYYKNRRNPEYNPDIVGQICFKYGLKSINTKQTLELYEELYKKG